MLADVLHCILNSKGEVMSWQSEALLWLLVFVTLVLIDDVTGSNMLVTTRTFFIVKGS